MSYNKKGQKELDRNVSRDAGSYLFNEGKPENWKNLYLRTHITTDAVFRASFHLDFIAQAFGSRVAAVASRLYQGRLLSIEPEPVSRPKQAVQVLAQGGGSTPQRNVYRSVEPSVEGYEEGQNK